MPFARLKHTKAGKAFYEIMVSRGRGKSYITKRWYVPNGWGQKAIDKELARVSAEFEKDVAAGLIVSRAEQKERETLEAAEAAKIVTLQQYAEKVFMPVITVRCAENTRSSFQLNLDKHIYPAIGIIKLPEVTTAQINALLLSLQSAGMKQASCVKVYNILNMLFKKAYNEGTIEKNPMDRVDRPRATKAEGQRTEIEAYTGAELKHIMECLETEPLKWRAYVRLLIDTGCRRGEALGLQWKNINFKDNYVVFEKTLNYTPKKGIYLDTPKNKKSRKVYVDPAVMALLKEIKNGQKVVSIEAAAGGFVFTQDNSTEPMHPQSPTRYFKKFGDRYGIQDFHPHKLRHSFASVAITNGADVASVSEKLGHADKGFTLRMYTHADAESQKRASEIFRNALQDKQG